VSRQCAGSSPIRLNVLVVCPTRSGRWVSPLSWEGFRRATTTSDPACSSSERPYRIYTSVSSGADCGVRSEGFVEQQPSRTSLSRAAISTRAPSTLFLCGERLAVVGQGVALIRSDDPSDSAMWLRLLAERVGGVRPGRDRPAYAQRLKAGPCPRSRGDACGCPRDLCCGIARSARSLRKRVRGPRGSESEWLQVGGIGPRRAAALRSAIS